MELKDIADKLHPLERRVLPELTGRKSVSELIKGTKLQEIEVMRALLWLQNKGLVKVYEKIRNDVDLDSNGVKYRNKGLPEKLFLQSIARKQKTISDLKKDAGLETEEINVSIGILKKNKYIEAKKGKELSFTITKEGLNALNKGLSADNFLQKKFPLALKSLSKEELQVIGKFKRRKNIIKEIIKKEREAEPTETAKSLLKKGLGKGKFIDRLTPELVKSGDWKKVKLRKYDINSIVPKIFGGKKQPYRRYLEEVREKFIGLGFEEMTGPIVETEFWNMDALFMPQGHSARDIHDAYYIKEPKYSKTLPKDIVEKVKKAHENGFNTESKGWRYPFDVQKTHRHVLRTQTTACSARMLTSKDLKIPGKYFAIARCFRYDVVDSTHLPDFNQVEGIVVEEGLTLRHLIGLLNLFARSFAGSRYIGKDKVKVLPAYFPFTEPSAALYAKHPKLGWIELGGAGIFRPEMMAPLGVKVPVLAWGIGIDRLAMFNLKINDIRQLFSHDLQFLRYERMM